MQLHWEMHPNSTPRKDPSQSIAPCRLVWQGRQVPRRVQGPAAVQWVA